MANQFSVQPLGGLQNVQMIGQGMQGLAQNVQADREEQRRQELMQQASEVYERGNPREIAQFSIANPEIGEALQGATTFASEATRQNLKQSMQEIIAGRNPAEVIQRRAEMVRGQNGDPSDTLRDLEMAQQDPEGYRDMISRQYAMMFGEEGVPGAQAADVPAAIRAFRAKAEAAGLEPGTPEYQQAAKIDLGMLPRAGMSAQERIALDSETGEAVAEQEAREAEATERATGEVRRDLEPQIAAAVDEAKAQVQAAAKAQASQKSNAQTLATYDAAMQNLANAMGETTTGPGIGWLPAVTANAQIAQGAQALMAPVLKSMFRTSGEGTFTDKDQELLMQMVPTRSDLPEARAAKIRAIDALVRAKLNQPAKEESDPEKQSIDDLVNKYAD